MTGPWEARKPSGSLFASIKGLNPEPAPAPAPAAPPPPPPAPAADLKPLLEKLEKLEARLARLEAQPAPAPALAPEDKTRAAELAQAREEAYRAAAAFAAKAREMAAMTEEGAARAAGIREAMQGQVARMDELGTRLQARVNGFERLETRLEDQLSACEELEVRLDQSSMALQAQAGLAAQVRPLLTGPAEAVPASAGEAALEARLDRPVPPVAGSVDRDHLDFADGFARMRLRRAANAAMSGRFDAAVRACQEALTAVPQDGAAWMRLGLAYYLAGDRLKARQAYARALELDPGHQRLRDFMRENL
ncbi:MAG: tetratricopeptide repeat protein [Elusimicrobiota bacterium]|jgi:tetratricopeptide (TPR) repeat protein